MRIQDFNRVCEVNGDDAIEVALSQRYGSGVNAFWLSHDNGKYPALWILANRELATLHYFPKDRHPGYRSIGKMQGCELEGMIKFSTSNNNADDVEVTNDAIVPFSIALKAAKEFLVSIQLPSIVEWVEL